MHAFTKSMATKISVKWLGSQNNTPNMCVCSLHKCVLHRRFKNRA
jgi:hypothetical protein